MEPAEYSIELFNSDNISYTIKFSCKSDKLDIYASNKDSFSLSYNASFTLEELTKLNRYFRLFDSILEIYKFISNYEEISEKIKIKLEDKFLNLSLFLPNIMRNQENEVAIFMLPLIKIKENDLIIKLCEQVSKIVKLEKKINYIFKCIGKTEEHFNLHEKIIKNIKYLKNIESKIIIPEDFYVVEMGI